ncbi:DUF6879 family protein [Nonomuraea cavernae]|uniref:DUF6879 family protein n=1 Tax=Nonomuraea cavernae TaxID=2045107 RepID=UPI0033E6782B
MRDLLEASPGRELGREAYLNDFDKYFWRINNHDFWKLERQQSFQEPGDDSWEAFAASDWKKSLQLLEERRGALQDYYHRIAQAGFRTWRVRVVGESITPYLKWELRLLRLRHEYGGSVRVIGAAAVRSLESQGQLPELVTLGSDVMYEVLYDEHGILAGGRRYTDPSLIEACRKIISGLYAVGEDVDRFFDRNRAELEFSHGDQDDR